MKKIRKYIPNKFKIFIVHTIPRKLRYYLFHSIYSYIQWYKLSNKSLIKLELGSGGKKGSNGFTTVDQDGADITWNLKRGLPLKDKSVDFIYSSHLLEHIPFKQLIKFLEECKRVLKEDGTFSVCVPNAGYFLNSYFKGEVFEWHNAWEEAKVDTGSKLDQLNYIAYLNEDHKYLFDEENLVNTLLTAGFSNAKIRKFDPNLDLKWRETESIYAEARKN